MKINRFHFIIVGCLPALFQGGDPVIEIEALLKTHVVLKDFSVNTPPTIKHASSTAGKLQLSGALKDKACTIILLPEQGRWDISGYSYSQL